MPEYDLSSLVWEEVKTQSNTFHKARIGRNAFSKVRRHAIKLAPGREFAADEVEFDLTVELITGTGILLHRAAISRIINPYRPGLTLIAHAGDALIFKVVREETIFVVSYQFP
jgi:hypothetical protein